MNIEELLQYKTIIFYKEEKQFPKAFIQHIKPPYTILNLSVDKEVEELMTSKFYIQKLPCMFINGQMIYEDSKNINYSIEEVKKRFRKENLNGQINTEGNEDLSDACIVQSVTTLSNIDTRTISFRALNIINKCLENKNFIFIKGTPDRPECGFTRQLIDLLKGLDLVNGRDYQYFNIFSDEDVRQTLKQINDWPTFPMIYLKKEFIGGLDVIKEMIEDKSIKKYINK